MNRLTSPSRIDTDALERETGFGWGWVAASGFVSVLSGLIFIYLLFANTVSLLGIALAVDLTFQGAMVIAFGVALRATTAAIPASMTEP